MNGFLDFLDFGPVGIGVRLQGWRPRGTPGRIHIGRRLLRNFSLLQARESKLVATAIWNSGIGLDRIPSPSIHRIEE